MALRICFFGTFSITYGDKTISEEDNRSKKLWKLLQYIAVNAGRPVPQTELIELLWGDSQGQRSLSSLKTLLHRVRNMLDELDFEESRKLILQQSGAYYWNTSLSCTVDAQEFEIAASDTETASKSEDRLNYALKALSLYKGHFLGDRYQEAWAKTLCDRFREKYLMCFETATALLREEKRLDEIVFLAQHAIEVDPTQEIFRYTLVSALIEKEDHKEALKRYEEALELFYQSYRITPSERFRSLYRGIIRSTNSPEMNISALQERLSRECTDAPIFCEYDTFKLMYALRRREGQVHQCPIYLILLTVCGIGGEPPSGKHLDRALTQLGELLTESLKAGDVCTRYSVTQLLVMAQMEREDAIFEFLRGLYQDFMHRSASIPVELVYKADLIK